MFKGPVTIHFNSLMLGNVSIFILSITCCLIEEVLGVKSTLTSVTKFSSQLFILFKMFLKTFTNCCQSMLSKDFNDF